MNDKFFRIKAENVKKEPYTLSLDYVRLLLGVCDLDKREQNRFKFLLERINELEEELEALLIPDMKKRILNLVRNNPDMKTREFTYKIWRTLDRRSHRGAYDRAFKELENSGAIIGTSQGPSLNRTWRLKE